MARALVTGSGDRVSAVADAFSADGVEVLTADGPADLGALGDGQVDHYVQLPAIVQAQGDNLIGCVRSFLSDGLLGRFALVERLLPHLADGASVVLVAGHDPGAALPDDQHSRLALLHVLAHATRAELASRGVRVTVASGARSEAELVRYARHGGEDPSARLAVEGAEQVSDEQYQDWRTEVMGMRQAHG